MDLIIQGLIGAIPKNLIGELYMKKDSELPWVIRLARWATLVFAVAYGSLVLVGKAVEIFK